MASSRKKPAKKGTKLGRKLIAAVKGAIAKPRVRKTVTNNETCLQMHTAQWLQKTLPNLLAIHVANERKGGFGTHVHFKRLGVKAGVADWLIFPRNGRRAAIELKDDEGEQRPDQEKFQKQWEASGGLYFLVRTLEEFQGVIAAITLFG